MALDRLYRYKIPIGVSLGVVAGILGLSIVASLLVPQKRAATNPKALDSALATAQGCNREEEQL